eukprot:376005-Pelagomonas_calceolata.AAC.1
MDWHEPSLLCKIPTLLHKGSKSKQTQVVLPQCPICVVYRQYVVMFGSDMLTRKDSSKHVGMMIYRILNMANLHIGSVIYA